MSHPAAPGSSGPRAVAAAAAGNALEWYDFTIYAYFAVYIAQNFFIGGGEGTALLQAFLAFGLGFIVRPVGAVVLGVYGDRAGRRAALTFTILAMAAGTAVIALAPTYVAIGFAAPLLIVLGRVLQGFSAGGEVGGAVAFLVEHAPARQRGAYAAWLQASMGVSNILGALVAMVITSSFTAGEIVDWAWRLPFLLGLLIAPVGLYLRSNLPETPEFEAMARAREATAAVAPLREILTRHGRALSVGIGLCALWAVAIYTLIFYMPTWCQVVAGYSAPESFRAQLIGNVGLVLAAVLAGRWSDRYGRRRLLAIGAAGLLVLVYPLMSLVLTTHSPSLLVAVQTVLCVVLALFSGVVPAALAELFPASVRSTGLSLAYNTAFTVLGGFAPAILTWLTRQAGGQLAPAWYVMAAAVVTLAAIPWLPRRAD